MLWPGYLDRAYPLRVLAFMRDHQTIMTEHGESVTVRNWPELRAALHVHNLTLYVDDLIPFCIGGAVRDKGARCNAGKRGFVSSISVRYSDHRVRNIVNADLWGEPVSFELLSKLRRLFRYVGVGDRTTPSALGTAVMREQWLVHNLDWHWAPALVVQNILRTESCGPRHESPGVGRIEPTAYEYDLNDAFASHFRQLPTGQTVTITTETAGEWLDAYSTWFRRCEVCSLGVPVSPVPVLDPETRQWTWPKIGTHVTWLWKEQAETAREIGIQVTPSYGFGWLNFTSDMSKWCDRVRSLKLSASAELLPLIKASIVAAIGRHAMQPVGYEVTDYAEPTGCKPLYHFSEDGSPFTDLYLCLRSQGNGSMIHWQRYSIMQTNQSLFRMAQQALESELLQTNFDSILTTRQLPLKPGWKSRTLTNVRMPFPRSVVSDQKTRLPGIPKIG